MKKLLSCFLVLLALALPMLGMEAQAATTGTCGEELTWSLDSKGTLTISGTGDMADYDSGAAPWYGQRTKIKSVVIEDGVTGIGEYAFYGCVKMTGITIADSVTQVEYCAFENCNGLTNVYITDIAAWLNLNNRSRLLAGNALEKKLYLDGELLTDLVIPEGVTEIDSKAFYNCSSLKSVTIPQGVTEIDSEAFSYCSSLKSVTIPDSVTYIGEDAFRGCTDLTDVYITDITAWVSIIFYVDSYEYNNANPLSVGDSGAKLHLNGKIVTNLVIPKGVTTIGDYAFNGCSSLKSVTIPDGVVEISEDAFSNCTSLEKVTIPDSVSVIADGAFCGCSSLKSVTIPEGVIEIGSYAFAGCSSLKSVTIPDSVSVITDGAFYACSSLTDVYVTDIAAWLGITFEDDDDYYYDEECANPLLANELGKNLYLDGELITDLVIPEGVAEIGWKAFYNCNGLKSVTIPDSVITIGPSAFSGCEGLLRVNITDIAAWCQINFQEYIGEINSGVSNPLIYATDGLYLNGKPITEAVLPEGITVIPSNAFRNCRNLSGIVIPDSVTSIEWGAFAYCNSLNSVAIPEGVTSIDSYTFYDCDSLINITIPESVTSIGDYAFDSCDNLSIVHYGGTEAQAADIARGYSNDIDKAVWHYGCAGDNCSNLFVDITPGAYYYEPVLWAVDQNITKGTSAITFAPDATCTRGQIVTFLWRANGSPEPKNSSNPFSDVSSSDYFYKAVLWAVEKGITSGMGDGSFSPNAPCTRGQVATFLWRACGQPAPSGTNIFTDIAPGAYYYDAVLWAVENSITNGMGDGTFAPDAPCTRGQIVTFLYRAMA